MLILAIFSEAFLRERTFRILPEVDLAFPTFVGPGGGPESNQGGHGHVRECTGSGVSLSSMSSDARPYRFRHIATRFAFENHCQGIE